MLIPISIGSLKVAALACIAHHEGVIGADRAKAAEITYQQLHDGAVHNGLKPSEKDLQTMREMADRDVDHAMERHDSKHYIEHCKLMIEAAEYSFAHGELETIIELQEFRLLKDFLPAAT